MLTLVLSGGLDCDVAALVVGGSRHDDCVRRKDCNGCELHGVRVLTVDLRLSTGIRRVFLG